jgi:conjugal transfer/entry exclusion protein
MDIQSIDTQYSQLQEQSRQTASEISTLADKLRPAAQSGNQDAREWMLDLKEIALAIQAERTRLARSCSRCTASSRTRPHRSR